MYGDLSNLPLEDNYADVCMCFSVLDIELDNLEAKLLELIRVTKPGGQVIIRLGKMTTPNTQQRYSEYINLFTLTHGLSLLEVPKVITKAEYPYTKNLFWVWKK